MLQVAGNQQRISGRDHKRGEGPPRRRARVRRALAGEPPYLVANRNDGIVTRVDFRRGAPSQSDIFSGGSRGDFVAVDSHGCLYITQSASIVQISGSDSTCGSSPTTRARPRPSE